MSILLLNVRGLLRDPGLLSVGDLAGNLIALLHQLVPVSLHGAHVLIIASVSQLGLLPVKTIDLELSHVDLLVAALDVVLEKLYLFLLISQLLHQFLLLLFKKLILLHTIQIIDFNSRNLV